MTIKQLKFLNDDNNDNNNNDSILNRINILLLDSNYDTVKAQPQAQPHHIILVFSVTWKCLSLTLLRWNMHRV